MSKEPYVLGTGVDELERLGLQHALWSDAAHAAWKRAGIGLGSRVLDVGSGPGFAASDLAHLVGKSGHVLAVDESPAFVDAANTRAAALGLSQLRAVVGDAQRLDLTEGGFDAAYARWVLCFVKSPEAVLSGIARGLRPGGRVIVHDYFNYAAMTMAPRRESHDRVVQATARSWRDHGGDPDVAGRLPRLMAAAGFEVERVDVHVRTARRGDPMLAWPLTWWRTYTPKLVEMGYVTKAECDELFRDLDDVARSETDFFFLPPVHEIVAVKRAS